MRTILFFLLCLFVVSVSAQSPGGVSSNLKAWYRFDAGVTNSGNNTPASAIQDQSGNNRTLTESAGNRPTYFVKALNFNPGCYFDGSSFRLRGTYPGFVSTTDPISLVSVSIPTGFGNERRTISIGNSNEYPGMGHINNLANLKVSGTANQGSDHSVPQSLNSPYIILGTANNATPKDVKLSYNGIGNEENFTGGSGTFPAGNNGNISIGSEPVSTKNYYEGYITEAIAYNKVLSTSEKERIYSYLAIKYGITLSQNYYASNSSLLWDISTYSAYSNNIIGIGRDDASVLSQRISTSSHPGDILTLSTDNEFTGVNTAHAPVLNDLAFVMAGHNNNPVNSLIPLGNCAAVDQLNRISRVWRIYETGTIGAIYLQANLSASGLNSGYVMLVSTDPAFGSYTVVPPSQVNAGNLAGFSYDFTPGTNYYITFAGLPGTCTVCLAGTATLNTGAAWRAGGGTAKTTNTILNKLVGATGSGTINANLRINYTSPAKEFRPNHYPKTRGQWVQFTRKDNAAAGLSTYTAKFTQAAKAGFRIAGLDKKKGQADVVTVKGFCNGSLVTPVLSYTRRTANSYTITGNTATGTGNHRDFSKKEIMQVDFTKAVDSISVEYTISRNPVKSRFQRIWIGTMQLTCDKPLPPVPDNVYVLQDFVDPNLFTCDTALLKIQLKNLNCSDRTINLSNILPSGLNYVADSYEDLQLPSGSAQPTYSGVNFTLNNLVVPPGEYNIYVSVYSTAAVTATYNVQSSYTVASPGSGATVLSDNFSATSGFNPSVLNYQASALPPMPTSVVLKINNMDSTGYIPANSGTGELVTYTVTMQSSTPLSGLEFMHILEEDQAYQAGSLVFGSGVSGTANNYGGLDEEDVLEITSLNIPAGTSTFSFSAWMNLSDSVAATIATLTSDPDANCSEATTIETNEVKAVPVCVKPQLVPLGTSESTITPTVNYCIPPVKAGGGAMQYYFSPVQPGKANVAIDPNGNSSFNTNVSQVLVDATNNGPFSVRTGNDSARVMMRMYTITAPGSYTTNGGIKVRLYFDSTEMKNEILNGNRFQSQKWFKYNGSRNDVLSALTSSGIIGATYLTPDSSGVEYGLNFVQFNQITSFSTFGFAAATLNALPLKLIKFDAKRADNGVQLTWITANEQSVSHFEIERSLDAANFRTIGMVAARGTGDNQYSFTDFSDVKDRLYYRIKIVDDNGSFRYSEIRVIVPGDRNISISVTPNPVSDLLFIAGTEAGMSISLVSADGKVLMNEAVAGLSHQVSLARYSPGLYFLRITDSTGKLLKTEKIIKY